MELLKPKVSIVICTFNRADLLNECLSSLMRQTAQPDSFEVIVVDNNSTDKTAIIAASYVKEIPFFRCVKEIKQGLGFARNKGACTAITDWVVYLDDDARASENFVERAIFVAENYSFDCFGGVYLPWFKFGRPLWYRDEYASNYHLTRKIGSLEDGFACGGIIAFKKNVILEFGGFPENVGMSGERISYGEENHLQKKIRDCGGIIGFDPDWQIHHLVSRSKLNPWWFVKSKFAVGRDSVFVYSIDFSLLKIIREIVGALFFLLVDSLISFFKLTKKNFYWQNIIVDVFSMFSWKCGRIAGAIKKQHLQ